MKTGERRFLELMGRYGRESVQGSIAAIMDRSEASARARTKAIPDGVYEAESLMDDDGVTVGRLLLAGKAKSTPGSRKRAWCLRTGHGKLSAPISGAPMGRGQAVP